MSFLTSGLLIVAGILTLFGGGELFVAGSVALSLLLGIPQIVIGLTVVSLGTSAPELFVSLLSTLQGGDNLAVSNVVGSNIFNVLVVLGISALVVPLRVKSRLVRRDVPLLLAVSMAVWGMASGSRITWQAGLALLVALVMTIIWETRTASENPEEAGEDLEDESSHGSRCPGQAGRWPGVADPRLPAAGEGRHRCRPAAGGDPDGDRSDDRVGRHLHARAGHLGGGGVPGQGGSGDRQRGGQQSAQPAADPGGLRGGVRRPRGWRWTRCW